MKIKPMTEAELFFHANAGYSYDPKSETPEDGRQRCARALAKAEAKAYARGFTYRWCVDEDLDSSEFSDERPAWRLWLCGMYNRHGQIVNSLSGIDFGRDGEPWDRDPNTGYCAYRRVVEAELAIDGLTNEPQGKGF